MIRAYIYIKTISNQPSAELNLNILNVQTPLYFVNAQSISLQFSELSPELTLSTYVSPQRVDLMYRTTILLLSIPYVRFESISSNLIYLKESDSELDLTKIIYPYLDTNCASATNLPFRHLKTNLRYVRKIESNILLSVFDQYFEFYISKNCVNCNIQIKNNKTGAVILNNAATSHFTYRLDPNFNNSTKLQNHDQLVFLLTCSEKLVDDSNNKITVIDLIKIDTIRKYSYLSN
jgi:hypothetical protein